MRKGFIFLLCAAVLCVLLPIGAASAADDGVSVTLTLPDGETAVTVRDADGREIAPEEIGRYRLLPDETYTYVATKNDYFHTTADFIAAEGLNVAVAAPETTALLTDFALYSSASPSRGITFPVTPSPEAARHEYTVTIPDTSSAVYLQATCSDSDWRVSAHYTCQSAQASVNGAAREQELPYAVDPSGSAKICAQLLAVGGNSNSLTLRLQKESSNVTYYQDYLLKLVRRLTLRKLSLSADGAALLLTDAQGIATAFSRDITAYYTRVAADTRELLLSAVPCSVPSASNPNSGGYFVLVNGVRYDDVQELSVPLTQDEQTLRLTVCHTDAASLSTDYTVTVTKATTSFLTVQTTPTNATAFVESELTGRAVTPAADGRFPLTCGDRYRITVTAAGYVGTQRTGHLAAATDEALQITLEKAPKNTKLQSLDADWPSFRADRFNNGVIDAPIPTVAEESVLYWAVQLGEGYAADAAGCPILVDGCLYTYARDKLYRLDKSTGEILAVGQMDHKSSFAINSPTYAEGMIFVGLADGCVQAFDAVTLEALWLYRDPLGGQPNCPLIYHNGYLYTGFWRQETEDANFVCLSVTDEDPTRTDEAKLASWYYTSKGGFYWAGAYVCDRFALVTTDDGALGYLSGHSRILSFDPLSGVLLDELTLPDVGDARSSVSFVEASDGSVSGTAYFTTKGGYFYGVAVDADGHFGDLRSVALSNGADDAEKPAMSTCTPTIYNGRAYLGVCGTAQFGAYSGHNLTVIDLAAMSVAYSVPTQGYPQTSGILTTAYDKGDGTVYVCFFDNYTPGKLRVLCDRAGQTAPLLTTRETANGTPLDTAYVLFTPDGEQAQYAICSPVIDADGTIYFKNDSGYLMALGSVPTALTVTTPPSKTDYRVGEVFDPSGMTVTAAYANGTTRDVTNRLSYSDAPLTADDEVFQLTLRTVLYQNRDGKAGAAYHAPNGLVTLRIRTTDDKPQLPTADFSDVAATAWYKGAVDYAVANGLMNGMSKTTFEPDGAMTRAMLVTVLWRYAGQPTEQASGFTDVPDGQWYSTAVAWAAKNSIVNGVGNGKFDPNGSITREQMAVILYRYANSLKLDSGKRSSLDRFADAAKVSSSATEALHWAVAEGIVGGSSDGGRLYLNPQGNATRAEVATLLMRYIENILK